MKAPFEIYTASFYQVRYFDSSVIGLSTAIYDPKWFHDKKAEDYFFVNENGFVCGLKAHCLQFTKKRFDELPEADKCSKDCPHDKTDCAFMRAYRQQLDEYGFENVMSFIYKLVDFYQKHGFNKTDKPLSVVLLVHESPSCKCAERPVIQKFFDDNWVTVKEWRKDDATKN